MFKPLYYAKIDFRVFHAVFIDSQEKMWYYVITMIQGTAPITKNRYLKKKTSFGEDTHNKKQVKE